MHNWNAPELIQKNLVIAVNRSGMKQREIAREIGVAEMTVSNWLCGRTTPSLDVLTNICKYLNVPIHTLFMEEDLPDKRSDKEERNSDVVFFQELNYVFLDKKRGYSTQYSLRTWPVPRNSLNGHPESELRLLRLFSKRFEPHFKEDDLLLLHCQSEVQDGDILYMIKTNGDPTVRQMKLDEDGACFLPFDPEEQSFHVSLDKLKTLNVFGRVIQMIRPLSPLDKMPDLSEKEVDAPDLEQKAQ